MVNYEQQFGTAEEREPEEKQAGEFKPLTAADFEKMLNRGKEERGSKKEQITQAMEEILGVGGSHVAKITFKFSAIRKINDLLEMVKSKEIKMKRDDEIMLQTAFDSGRWDPNRRKIKIEFMEEFGPEDKNDFIEEFGNFINEIETIN